jgi:hypothetical protein
MRPNLRLKSHVELITKSRLTPTVASGVEYDFSVGIHGSMCDEGGLFRGCGAAMRWLPGLVLLLSTGFGLEQPYRKAIAAPAGV